MSTRKFDRRSFIRASLQRALGGVAACSALGSLQLISAAANAQSIPPDYKALVCVFLYGGNDSFNTIVPYNSALYNVYRATRPAMALNQSSISAMALTPQAIVAGLPGGPPSDGGSYGLHPSMPELRQLFNAQRAAIIGNVGTLLRPTTQAQYQSGNHPLPPQLFSHDDQANFWQTARPDDANADGWGGRIADLLYSSNPNQQLAMNMSLDSQSLFQRGSVIDQYVMGSFGAERIDYLDDYQNELGVSTFNALMADGTQAHMFERAYAKATRRSISTYQMLGSALANPPTWTTAFPDTSLGRQLKQVAQIINARNTLNMRRQVFFVSQGNFDAHDNQLVDQAAGLASVSQALHAFYQATVQLGLGDKVTAFTASDFGRTLSVNGDGTDHGWGGHHFVVGGAVRGGRFYGQMPSLAQNGNPDDAGYGQIIPTLSVDQYAATLASWFGVSAGGINDLFPQLGQFSSSNLGFML